MQLLVLGDLHLGDEGYAAEPHPSWERFDAVVTVGDVAHSRVTITDGKPQQEELVGGVLNASPDRLEAAGDEGIPQVVSTGALDMVNFGPRDSVPEEFDGRQFHVHNPQVPLMRTTPEENAELGEIIAEKLNAATGPTALALPLEGVSALDIEGEDFHEPAADAALFDALRSTLDDDIELIEIETDINDEDFAEVLVETLDEYMRNVGRAL